MCLYADPLFDILLRSGLHGSCTAGNSAAGKRFFRHPALPVISHPGEVAAYRTYNPSVCRILDRKEGQKSQ